VAQALLNDLGVHAVTKEFARVKVTQVMETILNSGLPTDGPPSTLEVRGINPLSYPIRKHRSLVCIRWPECLDGVALALLMLPKKFRRLTVEVNHPPALRLRR
jgi:hypothetical protein